MTDQNRDEALGLGDDVTKQDPPATSDHGDGATQEPTETPAEQKADATE